MNAESDDVGHQFNPEALETLGLIGTVQYLGWPTTRDPLGHRDSALRETPFARFHPVPSNDQYGAGLGNLHVYLKLIWHSLPTLVKATNN